MHYHAVPVLLLKLRFKISCNIIINLCEILFVKFLATASTIQVIYRWPLTETKKLVVPSARAKVSGNNLSQVSSPNMISFPSGLFFNCDSQVS